MLKRGIEELGLCLSTLSLRDGYGEVGLGNSNGRNRTFARIGGIDGTDGVGGISRGEGVDGVERRRELRAVRC